LQERINNTDMAGNTVFEESLNDPEFWRRRLGLLPVPLRNRARGSDPRQFVLLNGNVGNFCLQVDEPVSSPAEAQSCAWSTDVGHHVQVTGSFVRVLRWGAAGLAAPAPRFAAREVAEKPEAFHRFLERNEPNHDQSIVAHATRVLRMLRGCLRDDTPPEDTVSFFLELLRQAVERQEVSEPFSVDEDVARHPARTVSSDDWRTLLRELTEERAVSQMRPYVDLMLRHASGTLFQEVHYTARIPFSRTLPGIAPVTSKRSGSTEGVFFTPPAIARTLVEEALAELGPLPKRIRVFDPACGSAEFLKEVLRQLSVRGWSGQLELIGWDLLESATSMAKFALAFEQTRSLPFKVKVEIRQQDSLVADEWPRDCTIVLMNPPFSSHQALSVTQREVLARVLDQKMRPNLAAAFLLRATTSVADGGVLASVLPASVLISDAAEAVRAKTSELLVPRLLAKLGSMTAFAGALVDASLYVGKKVLRELQPTRIVWADHRPDSMSMALRSLRRQTASGQVNEAIDEHSFSLYPADDVARSGQPWAVTRYTPYVLTRKLKGRTQVGDVFKVLQGSRTGHDVFIRTKSEVASLPATERKFFRPAVINGSVGDSQLNDGFYVWFPYGDGHPLIETEAELKRCVPRFYEILKVHRTALMQRATMDKSNWWLLVRHRGWQIETLPKLVTKYFGKAGALAYDTTGDFVCVVGHAWVPKSKEWAQITSCARDQIAYAYVALAASSVFELLLQGVCPSVAGGQFNLENRYIKNLPMPDLIAEARAGAFVVGELGEFGSALASGVLIDRNKLDEAAEQAFWLA
jgi:adenine-specific DNA-methyltransferase